MKTRILLLALAVLALAGCSRLTYKNGTSQLESTSFLVNRNISELSFDPKTGQVNVKGYANKQTEFATAVVEAATRGATSKP